MLSKYLGVLSAASLAYVAASKIAVVMFSSRKGDNP
jgi:hypothetical protein